MAALFHTPKAPAIPAAPAPTPAPPTIDQAAMNQEQQNLIRTRRGAAASVLAGQNPANPTTLSTPRLLGG